MLKVRFKGVYVLDPAQNSFVKDYWQQKRESKDIHDHYPKDIRVWELQKLLELKFQNSQTELKRKFYENMREIKSEIDSKQVNMAKHLRELKNTAQKGREEKEQLQFEVDRLKREKQNIKER